MAIGVASSATRIFSFDKALVSDTVWWNETYDSMFGPRPNGLMWQWWEDRIHDDDRNEVLASIQAALNGGENH